jgi:hypothetical protein
VIHQDSEKPVLFVPHFFSGASWLFAELAKKGPKGLKQFASFSAKSLRSSRPKKSKISLLTKGPFYS